MEGIYQTLPYPYLNQPTSTEYAGNNNLVYRQENNTLNWANNNTNGNPPFHHRHYHHHHHSPVNTGYGCFNNSLVMAPTRPKVSTNIWEDENTLCFQVDANRICVARREDNDMINGTKLLNVVGMSRGKRDGILKNEKGRVVVKVGAMHLKGVWIPFQRARELANKFKIVDLLYPLFADDPSLFLCNPSFSNELNTEQKKMGYLQASPIPKLITNNYDYRINNYLYSNQDEKSFYPSEKHSPPSWYSPETPSPVLYQQNKRKSSLSSNDFMAKKLKVLQIE